MTYVEAKALVGVVYAQFFAADLSMFARQFRDISATAAALDYQQESARAYANARREYVELMGR